MKPFEYLDILYVQKRIEQQKLSSKKDFSLKLDVEQKTIHTLIGWIRTYLKFVAIFQITFNYLKCLVLNKFPQMPDIEQVRKDLSKDANAESSVQEAPKEMVQAT